MPQNDPAADSINYASSIGIGIIEFDSMLFEEIESGNIKHFCEEILNTVNNYPKNWDQKTRFQRKQLIQKYSIINEEKLIKKLINKVYSCY